MSVTYIVLPVVLLASACIGFFGAFLNIASGVALAAWSTSENRGLYSGIFNAFNQGSVLPGNVLAIFMVRMVSAHSFLHGQNEFIVALCNVLVGCQ